MSEKSQVGIVVNAAPTPVAVGEAGNIVLKILASDQDQETIRTALHVFGKLVEPSPTNIRNCHVEMDPEANQTPFVGVPNIGQDILTGEESNVQD